ncbi:ABC transporter permease [Chloroflexi bacterium TSY]|nr:ABC transporter permease [Chloroflexi bacterium TSY]
MITYVIRRLLWALPVLFLIVLVTFSLSRALPGGPFDRIGDKSLPESVRKNLERKYNLDKSYPEQFMLYLRDLSQGDLGPSFSYRGRSVNQIIAQTFPISFQLGILSILLGLLIGIPTGIASALRHNTWIDYFSSFIAVLGLSIPNIVLAPLLIFVFAVLLGWFPAARWGVNYKELYLGFIPPLNSDFWTHAVLPVITLGTGISATFARLARASLLQTVREDYIRTARAKGLSNNSVIARHALKNSMIPVITILGPVFAGVVTGTFIVERIFGIAGMGEFFVTSITNRDYPVILGTTLLFSVLLVLANLFVDIMYAWLDPRIRYN